MRQPHPHLRRQRHRALTALFVGIALLTASCSNIDGSEAATTETTARSTAKTETTITTPPVSTATTEETTTVTGEAAAERPVVDTSQEWETIPERILGRYLLYNSAWEAAAGPPGADPDYAPLQDLMAAEMAEGIGEDLANRRDIGEVVVVSEDSHHRLRFADPSGVFTEVEGVRVVIQDCFVWIGESIVEGEAKPFASAFLGNARMIFEGGEWLVHAQSFSTEESDGYDECQAYGECVLDDPGGDQCELWTEAA